MKCVFLNGAIEEEGYIKQPLEYKLKRKEDIFFFEGKKKRRHGGSIKIKFMVWVGGCSSKIFLEKYRSSRVV